MRVRVRVRKTMMMSPSTSTNSNKTTMKKRNIHPVEPSTVYNAEKLGHLVLIMFEHADQTRAFYPGTIIGYKIMLRNKTDLGEGLAIAHLVEFEDGDERWFDLTEEESMGRLQWRSMPSAAASLALLEQQDSTPLAKKLRVSVRCPSADTTAAEDTEHDPVDTVNVVRSLADDEPREEIAIPVAVSTETMKSEDDNQNVAPVFVSHSSVTATTTTAAVENPVPDGSPSSRAAEIRDLCLPPPRMERLVPTVSTPSTHSLMLLAAQIPTSSSTTTKTTTTTTTHHPDRMVVAAQRLSSLHHPETSSATTPLHKNESPSPLNNQVVNGSNRGNQSQIHQLKPKLPTSLSAKKIQDTSSTQQEDHGNCCHHRHLVVAPQSCSDSTEKRINCLPLKPPIPSRFQGDMDKGIVACVPEFARLMNFSSLEQQAAPDGMRCCVMCGDPRPFGGNRHMRGGAQISIPHQNKGLCTRCDVNVWVVAGTGLQIKWCKRCKNFRPWAAFGVKGGATKCAECREQQRQKYALQKKEKTLL